MNKDGSRKKRLTDNAALDEYPAFSPDGEKIVFDSDRGGNDDVYTMNSDGSKRKNLTQTLESDYNADWGVS